MEPESVLSDREGDGKGEGEGELVSVVSAASDALNHVSDPAQYLAYNTYHITTYQ